MPRCAAKPLTGGHALREESKPPAKVVLPANAGKVPPPDETFTPDRRRLPSGMATARHPCPLRAGLASTNCGIVKGGQPRNFALGRSPHSLDLPVICGVGTSDTYEPGSARPAFPLALRHRLERLVHSLQAVPHLVPGRARDQGPDRATHDLAIGHRTARGGEFRDFDEALHL